MLHSRGRFGFLVVLPVLLALGPTVRAQGAPPGSIIGSVRTLGEGTRIEGVRVELVGTTHRTVTSARGEFAFRDVAPGKYLIQASAIGYATLSSEIEVKPRETLQVEFQAQPESLRLPELVTAERPNLPPEFVRRSQEGGGRYMSRADIERRAGAETVGDLLRTFPGVRINCRRYPCILEFTRTVPRCPPSFWMDGMSVDAQSLMSQPPRELDGIEVYSGLAETPPELRERNTCGAFVIWTRTPPSGARKPKKP